jgi:hypothetical protein
MNWRFSVFVGVQRKSQNTKMQITNKTQISMTEIANGTLKRELQRILEFVICLLFVICFLKFESCDGTLKRELQRGSTVICFWNLSLA